MINKPKGHKQIQVEYSEWEKYKRLANELSKELDIHVPINALVKRAVTVYEATLKKTKDDLSDMDVTR